MKIEQAKDAARNLLKKLKIASAPVDVQQIVECLQIAYQKAEMDDELSGILDRKEPRIFINAAHAIVRQRFSAAHELGHYLLHSKLQDSVHVDNAYSFRDARSSAAIFPEEIEANSFAAELLMPSEFIRKSVEQCLKAGRNKVFEVVESLSQEYEVSQSAIKNRLKNLGYITQDVE